MRRSKASTDSSDAGSAPLEFIAVGLLLLVPLVYLVLAAATLQAHALGAESAARHVARAIAQADGIRSADARAGAVLATTAREYGMDASAVVLSISCEPAAPCPAAGATVRVDVRTRVALPLVPPVFGLERIVSLPVEATAMQKVSRFWGAS
ncbi:TadE family protein [Microbacterium limosum]|uniref:TadE family protein n=1 Tax=Microbacterium limosum TaxID=3079935 RepID=A0AAU0MDK0_9MICO|nr:TadE family protein [Microbacterium sp. Y20]WOQ68583.1 TadE family protein [Microbacterium sp. Y20]